MLLDVLSFTKNLSQFHEEKEAQCDCSIQLSYRPCPVYLPANLCVFLSTDIAVKMNEKHIP